LEALLVHLELQILSLQCLFAVVAFLDCRPQFAPFALQGLGNSTQLCLYNLRVVEFGVKGSDLGGEQGVLMLEGLKILKGCLRRQG
jgi:hypothetical protein